MSEHFLLKEQYPSLKFACFKNTMLLLFCQENHHMWEFWYFALWSFYRRILESKQEVIKSLIMRYHFFLTYFISHQNQENAMFFKFLFITCQTPKRKTNHRKVSKHICYIHAYLYVYLKYLNKIFRPSKN